MRRITSLLAVLALCAGLTVALAAPAGADNAQVGATAQGATLDGITRVGCVVTTTFTVEDAGTYAVNVWDDGTYRTGSSVEASAGGTYSISYTVLWETLQGATGVGVYVQEQVGIDAAVTYASNGSYTGSDAVSAACAASNGTDSGEPPSATINSAATNACALSANVTTGGLGDYRLVTRTTADVVVFDQPFTGTAGQTQDLTGTLTPPLEGTYVLSVASEDGETVYDETTLDAVSCLPVVPVTPEVVAQPRFTG